MSEREEKTDERERSSFLGEKKKGDALSHASESCSAVHKRTERDGDGVVTDFGAASLKKQAAEAEAVEAQALINPRPPAMDVAALPLPGAAEETREVHLFIFFCGPVSESRFSLCSGL